MPSRSDTAPRGAYLVVNGRRWRASDPAIPATFRQELVNELMEARREVGQATNEVVRRRARARVNDAKVALGERGRAWWLPAEDRARRSRIDATMRALVRARRDRSICPSDVARIVGGAEWRALLALVRTRAVLLARRRVLVILRRGQVVTEDQTSGVLRYALRTRVRGKNSPATAS